MMMLLLLAPVVAVLAFWPKRRSFKRHRNRLQSEKQFPSRNGAARTGSPRRFNDNQEPAGVLPTPAKHNRVEPAGDLDEPLAGLGMQRLERVADGVRLD